MRPRPLFGFTLLAFATAASAQTLELKSGEVLIGRVTTLDDKTLTIEVGYPEPQHLTLARKDVAPASLYNVLAARSEAASAQAHLALAETCRELGLPAHAIAEYREAARLDAALRPKADARIAALREEIASDLLAQAKDALAENRYGSAQFGAQAIADQYSDTPAAKDAQRILADLKAKSGGPTRKVTAAELEAALKKAAAHAREAEQKGPQSAGHGTSQHLQRLERATLHLERAWETVEDLAAPDDAPQLADRLTSLRDDVRRQLVATYLAAGEVYVQRRAFPEAERYCEKACDLDPQGKPSHELHRLILQGKITTGWRN